MSKVIKYLTKVELIQLIGKDYRSALRTLRKSGLILSYEDCIAVTLDQSQSIHLQTVLEFNEVKTVLPHKSKQRETD